MKYLAQTILTLVLAFSFSIYAHAADLVLTNIGGLDTGGSAYTEWWYSGTNPLLKGTAVASATVQIKAGETTESVTADASGNWTYQLTANGDTAVTFTSGEQTYTTTLHLGQTMPAEGSAPVSAETAETAETGAVPDTGASQTFGIAFGFSMIAAGLYLYLEGKKEDKKSYVDSMLDSLK